MTALRKVLEDAVGAQPTWFWYGLVVVWPVGLAIAWVCRG